MKSRSLMNVSPYEGLLIQQIVKRGLVALSLAIILLSSVGISLLEKITVISIKRFWWFPTIGIIATMISRDI